jgi:hypothetical protein
VHTFDAIDLIHARKWAESVKDPDVDVLDAWIEYLRGLDSEESEHTKRDGWRAVWNKFEEVKPC